MQKFLLVFLLASALWSSPAIALASPLLKGGVEHSHSLPPLSPQLKPGQKFDKSQLKESPNNRWYKIPAWHAGHWVSDFQTIRYFSDLRDGNVKTAPEQVLDRGMHKFGQQRDRTSAIWEFDGTPYTTTSDCGDEWQHGKILQCEPLSINDSKVVKKFVSAVTRVRKSDNTIRAVYQQESIQTYTPRGQGYVLLQTSIKTFDSSGKPLTIQQGDEYLVRQLDFEPIDYYRGRDLRALFAEYLILHGHADLVPEGSYAALLGP